MIKRIMLLVMVGALCLAPFAGCMGNSNSDAITIRYFVGGYGSSWLVSATQKYKELHPGTKFNLIEDADVTANVSLYCTRSVPDIMLVQDCEWPFLVSQGYLEPLDDVYEAEVQVGGGTQKVKDFLIDDLQDYPYMQVKPNSSSAYRPWVMPVAVLNTSIVYNESILQSTPRRAVPGTNWQAAPETLTELKEFMEDINAAAMPTPDGSATVAPFAWGGNVINWLEFGLYPWWAQLQGMETVNAEAFPGQEMYGTWQDFWDFGSQTVPAYSSTSGYDGYKQPGLWSALDILKDLFVDTTTQKWKNVVPNNEGMKALDVERSFISGNAAMAFCGSWLQNEMKDFLPEGFKLRMMPVPIADGMSAFAPGVEYKAQRDAQGRAYRMNFAQANKEIMIVPSAARHKEVAKDFLAFLSSEEMVNDFTMHNGILRPFKYDPVELAPEGHYSQFNLDCFDLSLNADYNLTPVSRNNSLIYRYFRPDIFEVVSGVTALNQLKRLTGRQIMIDGNLPDYKSVYQSMSDQYEYWKSYLGLT